MTGLKLWSSDVACCRSNRPLPAPVTEDIYPNMMDDTCRKLVYWILVSFNNEDVDSPTIETKLQANKSHTHQSINRTQHVYSSDILVNEIEIKTKIILI